MHDIKSVEELPVVLSVQQFAAITGLSRPTAYKVVRDEGLCIQVGGRLLIPKDRVISFLQTAS